MKNTQRSNEKFAIQYDRMPHVVTYGKNQKGKYNPH